MSNDPATVELYRFTANTPLGDAWNIQANPNGPLLTEEQGFLRYQVGALPIENQWTMVSMSKPYRILRMYGGHGVAVAFQLRANRIDGDEVKFSIGPAGRVILRFTEGGKNVEYVYSDNGFHNLGQSAIRADGQWHRIILVIDPDVIYADSGSDTPPAVNVFEDEKKIFNWAPGRNYMNNLSGDYFHSPANLCFNMQVLTKGAGLSFDMSDVVVIDNFFSLSEIRQVT